MIDSRRNYMITGGFVVVMLAILVVWIAILSGGTGSTTAYWIRYQSVMGLSSGTQILFEGYPVGRIEGISPLSHAKGGGFRLDVSVDSGWPIPVNSTASVTAGGLLSAVVVNIDRGGSSDMLTPGSEIPSEETPGLMAALSSVAGQVGGLVDDLKPALASVTDGVPEVMGEIRRLTDQLNEGAERLNAMLSKQNAERVSEILSELQKTASNSEELTRNLRETRANLDQVLASAGDMVDENRPDVRQAISDLQTSLLVLADHMASITRNLDSTMRNMNEFSAQIRQDPRSLLLPSRPASGEDQ